MSKDGVVDLYERHATSYDRDRGRSLQERAWLDRFLSHVSVGGTVLDVGCGMGEPIARYIIERGFSAVGVDSSPAMIARCHARFPAHTWHVADMRTLDLGRRFDGLVAWDSFFHLGMREQRAMFPRFAAHVHPGAPLLFTSGPAEGEAIGSYGDEPLYHASLAPAEYEALLRDHGFAVEAFNAHDEDCGGHTVWLATFSGHPDQVTGARTPFRPPSTPDAPSPNETGMPADQPH
jgi:cyclopropane fatty-acyl-phospholipid synthase-like methyltransferase